MENLEDVDEGNLTDDDPRMIEKSLQIKVEPRFAEIDNYRQVRERNDGHFARLVEKGTRKSVLVGAGLDAAYAGLLQTELQNQNAESGKTHELEQRIQWQETFDRQVKRLLLDFHLTQVPSARLNHLDRMHEWFTEHGQKQTRKARKAPNYLIADRNGIVPTGSTVNVPKKLSETTMKLNETYSPRARLERPGHILRAGPG